MASHWEKSGDFVVARKNGVIILLGRAFLIGDGFENSNFVGQNYFPFWEGVYHLSPRGF